MDNTNNIADLVGTLAAQPAFSHRAIAHTFPVSGTDYYAFPLEIARLSGTADSVNIIVSEETLSNCCIEGDKARVAVHGEVRTFNNKSGVGAKLIISVYAKSIELTNEDEKNLIMLKGVLCKAPNLRKTPMGREICDLMLAVNRRYGRSDYIPCIAWGRNAVLASDFEIGSEISVSGRLQSRKYLKVADTGESIEKIAFEVSVVEFTE